MDREKKVMVRLCAEIVADTDLYETDKEMQNLKFYCATYGEHGLIPFIADLLKPYGAEDRANKNF